MERYNSYEEPAGSNALGNEMYRRYKSHFDLYLSLPNPLPHKQLDHESPETAEDLTKLGDWLRKYTPYGAYVFNREENVSKNLDFERTDMIDPIYDKKYTDIKHPYGDFLYFNDRTAPVRYDRALSWEKPFDDQCDHQDFRFESSLDLLRSPFTGEGDRIVVGANGILHVFDDNLGRMDFNAETLEKIG
jgi:hypothetical protein